LNFILNKFWVFKPIQEKKDIVGDIYNAVHLSSDDSSKVN
jgi:putative flippase GtrA